MSKPSPSNLVIAALWALSLVGVFFWKPQMPPTPSAEQMSLVMTTTLLLLPILFFGAVSFFGPAQSPFYHPKLARFVNARYGEQACESFLVRLKPMLLFGVPAVLQGASGLWWAYSNRAPHEAYIPYGFYVSAGLSFMLAHIIWYVRQAIGVFPTWTLVPAGTLHAVPAPTTKPLGEAIRTYWWTLIGIAIFPTIFMIGGEVFKIPFEFFVLPFYTVSFLAGWPVLSGKAPYSFWLVAVGLWLVAGICAVILLALMHTVLS